MDADIPKLPKYVFQRANGSYRYKRNVPKALREVIPKATVYRQLGDSYDESMTTASCGVSVVQYCSAFYRGRSQGKRIGICY